jgi:hypothetical protein
MITASLIVGVDWPLPQDVSITVARHKGMNVLPKMFMLPLMFGSTMKSVNSSRRTLENVRYTNNMGRRVRSLTHTDHSFNR